MFSSIQGFLGIVERREKRGAGACNTFSAEPHLFFRGLIRQVGRAAGCLQKNTKTKKGSTSTQFCSLPTAALSWGLLKTWGSPSPPAETSGGCCCQVILASTSLPISIDNYNTCFHNDNSILVICQVELFSQQILTFSIVSVLYLTPQPHIFYLSYRFKCPSLSINLVSVSN